MLFVGIGLSVHAISQIHSTIFYIAPTQANAATHSSLQTDTPLLQYSPEVVVEKDKKEQDVELLKLPEEEEPTLIAFIPDDAPVVTIKTANEDAPSIFTVPFYSQFQDITPAKWKKVSCGIVSLAMLIEFYEPGIVSVDSLLQEGIEAGAYLSNAGWTYKGLIDLSKKYNLTGLAHDYGPLSTDDAFLKLETDLKKGPVMASVHYTFEPTNPIPHLVIINGIEGDVMYYNDPADDEGGGTLSVEKFKKSWKRRYIEFQPAS